MKKTSLPLLKSERETHDITANLLYVLEHVNDPPRVVGSLIDLSIDMRVLVERLLLSWSVMCESARGGWRHM